MGTRTFGRFGKSFEMRACAPQGDTLVTGKLPPGIYELEVGERDVAGGDREVWLFLRGTRTGFREGHPPDGLLELETLTDAQVEERINRLWEHSPSPRMTRASNAVLRELNARQAVVSAELSVYLRFCGGDMPSEIAGQMARGQSMVYAALSGCRDLAFGLAERYRCEGGTLPEAVNEWFRLAPIGRRLIIGYGALLHAVLDASAEARSDLSVALFLPLCPMSWAMHPEEHAAGHPLYARVLDQKRQDEARQLIRKVLTDAANEGRVVWAHPERGMGRSEARSFLDRYRFGMRADAPEPVLVSDVTYWHALADLMAAAWPAGSIHLTVV